VIGVDATRRPLLVGIGGDSGCGKSTLTAAFYDITALNPRANNFALMEENLWALKRGETVSKPVYNHSDGSFGPLEDIVPREVVIVQGLHPFLVSGIRHAFDLKVWLDPEPELRLQWKIQRDVAKRGYTVEQVQAELEARRPDAMAYIEPQRREADMVVRFRRPDPGVRNMDRLNVRIEQRPSLPRLAFDHRLEDSRWVTVLTDQQDHDGLTVDVIEIDGRLSVEEAALLEESIWSHIDERHHHLRHVPPASLGAFDEPVGRSHSDPLALCQLVLAHRILSAEKSLLVRVTEADHEHLAGEHTH
jgi:phosphoribulokinase